VLAGLSPARRRLVVGVLALVVAAALALTTAVLLRPDDEAAEPAAQEALESLAERLRTEGRDATVVALPGNGTGDLRESAATLDREVTAALARTGADTVDVVGYSAGGLIARLWVADGGADTARRVLTLGSPHHGTQLADLAGEVAPQRCPVGCQQMATDSELLAQLNGDDETPVGPTWVSIWTTQDETITPPDSSRLDGAVNLPVQSVCAEARINHGQLPRVPLVQEMVVLELAAGDPVQLGPGDCGRLSS
jgi:triacylglycerol lipase